MGPPGGDDPRPSTPRANSPAVSRMRESLSGTVSSPANGLFRILADAVGRDKAVRQAFPPAVSRPEASIIGDPLNSLEVVATFVGVHLSWRLFLILTSARAFAQFGGMQCTTRHYRGPVVGSEWECSG